LRTLGRWAAGVAAAAFLFTALSVGNAAAHGAVDNPISRAAACAPNGGPQVGSPACQAAAAASGTRAFDGWDNIRVADVRGRDRAVIPDGELCSAGIDRYAGLDLARADWPTTKLNKIAAFSYRTTIPHRGTFKLYITKDSYDPSQKLTWSTLEQLPFLSVTDPPVREGAYVLKGSVPANKSGRHLIYTIWQTSDTPDTYYSCSDVELAVNSVPIAPAAAATPEPPAPEPNLLLPIGIAVGMLTALAVGVFALRRRILS
jgi:chitin-binding protein